MSFLAWLAFAFFQSQLGMSMSSLVDPPVNESSASELTASAMNLVDSADDVPALTWFQSSPGVPLLATALPSSSKRPSSCTAPTGDARAKLKYWRSNESTNSADQDRATPRLTRRLTSPSAPHEVIRPSLSRPSDDE